MGKQQCSLLRHRKDRSYVALAEEKYMADRPLDPGGPSQGIVQQVSNQVARDVDRLHTLVSAAS